METVKVDVQKLQILNDRLTQCLEALGQVRLSAHSLQPSYGTAGQGGISHTNMNINPFVGQVPFVNPFMQTQGYGYNQPYGVWNQGVFGQQGLQHTNPFTQNIIPQMFGGQFGQQAFGYNQPYTQPYNVWNQQTPFGFGGISHSNPWQQQMGSNISPQIVPQLQQLAQVTQNPWYAQTQQNPFYGTGLSHTSVLTDPFVATRIAQTFPFAFYNTPVW